MLSAQRPASSHRTLAAVVLTVLALLVPVSAASAHDSLVGTSPTDGQTLDVAPEAIELTFTNPPVELGSEVSVADADGTNWADGPVQIVGDTATQPLKPGAPAGEYTVTWRVVSSDSHPIEGVYTFTTTEGAGSEGTSESPTETASAEASAQATAPGVGPADPLVSPSSDAQPEQEVDQAATVFPTIFVAIMIGVLVLLVIVIAVLARRRLGPTGRDDRA